MMRYANKQHGFTLLELITVVAIIAILGGIAVVGYQQYTMRARASDIVLKYDAIRTEVGVHVAKSLNTLVGTDDCAALASGFSTSNLANEYVTLAYGWQAVSGGHRPVLTVCAKADASSNRNVLVAKGAYETMLKTGSVEKDPVVTESMVSFALPLTSGDEPLCKSQPAKTAGTACDGGTPVAAQPKSQADCQPHQHFVAGMGCNNVCNPGMYFVAGPPASCSSTPPQPSAKVPTPVAAQTPAQAAYAVPTPATVAVPRCATVAAGPVERKVMAFGPALTGHIMNNGDLNTGGNMREFTAEVAIVGGTQVAAAAGHGATILSYATRSMTNEFLIWNPSSLTIEFKNVDIDTHVNVNDGQNHRLTTTWQSATGALILYDNGKEVWRGTVNQGGTIGGNGKLVLGQDQDSYGGGFGTNDAFQGKIITASLASAAATGAQVGGGPIQTTFNSNNGLITNVVLDANGQPVDTTQRHTYTAGGSMTVSTEKVDTGLYVTANCN